MELEQTFKLTIHENAVRHDFESREPVMFEQVGVRVDKLRLEQRSMEIYARIEYTVVDPDAYAKTDGGLWFEFIDPESTADKPHEQRLSDGPTGFGEVHGLNDTTFVQSDSLGMNELHSVYTLRAYECWEKQRFDTHEIPVYEVVKEQ